ncbi:DGQHR domain-containing protein, partial [Escherichia coli]|nr:hypothetical protein [Escherichia coli]EFN9915638.1 hypothetical protein [Escherichia coli]EIW7406555.1 hypothetical protein [Escherichia coli]MHP62069.1 hypothetical protein [Escherichia coli]HBE5173420.1 hypothetical protein [Escherichia coli]
HAVMINAFGYAMQELLRHRPAHIIVQMIEELVTKSTMAELEDFFLISSWDGVCADASKERATVIASIPAQKAAAQELALAITAGAFFARSTQ